MLKNTFLYFLLFLPSLLFAQEIKIYELSAFRNSDGIYTDIITLTDSYEWSEHPDSGVIEEKYLHDDFGNDNYHVLSKENRKRFLYNIPISEADSIYIYNLNRDSIFTYEVKDLQLVAFVNPYETSPPFGETSFMIGLQIDDIEGHLQKDLIYLTSYLVYIGKKNPFLTGNIKPLAWQKSLNKEFPLRKSQNKILLERSRMQPQDTYIFSADGYKYMVQSLAREYDEIAAYHLIIIDQQSGDVVHDNLIMRSEGTYLFPLNFVNEHQKTTVYQWTGRLFKDLPPVIHGFASYSFGCPLLHFLSPEKEPVWIRCDNRH